MAQRSYAVRLEAEYQAFVQAMDGAAKAVDKVGDAADKASKRVDSATKSQADAAGRLRTAEQQLADARAKHPAQSAQVVAAEERVAKARRDLDKATDDVTSAEAELRAAMSQTDAAAKQQETTFGRLAKSADQNREAWDRAGTALTAFGAVTTVAMGATVKAAMDWESAWTGVLKTVDGTPAQLAAVETGLRQLAKTLPASHQEIAAVAEAAGQLGVSTPGIVDFTKTMIDLGETTNLTSDEAATAIAQMANVMGLKLDGSTDDVQRFGATLVELGNNGASTEKDILMMSQRIAGAGALVGATSGEVLALSNALASMGVTAELGGSVTSRVLQRIYTAAQDGGEALEGFARVAGMSASDFATAFEEDPIRALDSFAQGLNGVEASGGNVVTTLSDLGIKSQEEQRVLLQLKASGDLLAQSLDDQARAWEENTALVAEAEKRYDTTEAKLQIAKNSINDAAITIGEAFLPALASGAEAVAGLAEAFSSLPAPVQQTLGGLTGLVGVAALVAGGFLLMFPRVLDTVRAFRDLRDIAPGAATGLGKIGKAAGLATVAITAMMASAALPKWGVETSQGAGEAAKALLDVATGAKTADQAFSTMFSRGGFKDWITGNDVDNIEKAYEVLKNPSVSQNIDNTISSILTFGQATSTNRMQAEEFFNTLDQGLSSLVMSGAADEARAALEGLGIPIEGAMELLPLYADALASTDVQQQLAAGSADGLAAGVAGVGPATEEAIAATEEWLEMVSTAAVSFSDIGGAYQDVIDQNRALAEETAAATDTAEDSWEDFYDGTTVSMDDWIAKLQEQAQAQANWRDNILTITAQIREEMPADMQAAADAMIDELIAMGPEGAAALQTFRDGTAAERLAIVEAWMQMGGDSGEGFASELEAARQPEITPTVNDELAQEDLAALLAQIDHSEGTVTVDGDWGPAGQVLDTATASIDAASGTVTIFGNDGQAVTTLSNYTATVDRSRGTVTIRGNDASGRATTVTLTNWVDAQGASINVDADTSSAHAKMQSFFESWSGKSITNYVETVQTQTFRQIFIPPGGYTGGKAAAIAGYAGGGSPAGGRVPGVPPADPTADNLLAFTERGRPLLVRSREWIMQEPSTDYYGDRLMAAINNRSIDRDALASLAGFATGGRPSANYARTGVDNATAYQVARAPHGAGYGPAPQVTKHYTAQVYPQRASIAEVNAAMRALEANDYEPGGGW